VNQRVGQFPIIRQKKNAGRIPVEPTNGVDPIAHFHIVHHRDATSFVTHRCNAIFGLVQEEVVDLPLQGDDLSLDGHAVGKRIDLYSKLADDLAINFDDTGENQFIILAARANPCESEKPI
jgi:hypothetical protein